MRSFYSDILELPIRSDRKEFINFDLNSFRLTITVHSEIKNFAKDPLRIMINLGTPQIQETYKIHPQVKKKVLKPSEKFKISFDWDMNDDTSRELNPLYQVVCLLRPTLFHCDVLYTHMYICI